jgi:hypothetical protein
LFDGEGEASMIAFLVGCRDVYTRRVTFRQAVKLHVIESRIIEGMEVEVWFGRCRVHRDEWYGMQILTQNQQFLFTHSASSDYQVQCSL